ncbi:MAG TPA: DUF4233 domain-containing protein [Dermatophilaceae bacterium]
MRVPTLYGAPGKMTRRLAGTVIGGQGLAVFFGALVARGLASANGSDTSSTFLLVGSLLAVLCILDAGLLRRPWGVTLGWTLQIATLACAFVVPMMLFVGVLFGALWLTALAQGRAMDEHVKQVDAKWYAAEEASGPAPPSPDASAQLPSEQELPAPDPTAQRPSAQDG